MNETIDVSKFETGVAALAQKLPFPPGPDGQPMPMQQKSMLIMQFIIFSLMS
ncbi:MAG: hypothetical protein IJT62_00790 [Oscillospiraceae bacterium]|nr:hypothetical protein [Oscillospiraceae bacterium]